MSKHGVQIRINGPPGPDGSLPLEPAGRTYDGTHIPDEHKDLDLPRSAASEDRLRPVGPVSADPPPDSGRNIGVHFGDLPYQESRGIKRALSGIDTALKLSGAAIALAEIDNLLQADRHLHENLLSDDIGASS